MPVVAVTRNGLGDFYLFDTFEEADCHPIVQFGDVICCGPERISSQYNKLQLPDLLRRLGDEVFRREVLMQVASPMGREEALRRYTPRIFEMMVSIASRPPSDPAEVFATIVRDRKITALEGKRMSDTTTTEEAKASKKTKETKEKAEAAPRTIAGHPVDAKITMLCDAKGVPYGKDNNPKRPGSKTHERFSYYVDGMTVGKAIEEGLTSEDLVYDAGKGFIKIG